MPDHRDARASRRPITPPAIDQPVGRAPAVVRGPIRPLAVRMHAVALRLLAPSLDRGLRAQASLAFCDLDREARAASWRRRLGLWGRELRAMLGGALRRRRPSGGRRPSERPRGRSTWLRRGLGSLHRDLGYAARSLRRSPGFSLVAIACLSLGGTTAIAVFSLVNALVLRPPPHVADPETLVKLEVSYGGWLSGSASYWEFLDLRRQAQALDGLVAFDQSRLAVAVGEEPARGMMGGRVSASFFELLGVRLPLGRGFSEADEVGGERVAVIGHRLWQRAFDGDPAALGAELRIDGERTTVIGVAPPGLLMPGLPVVGEVWMPALPGWRERTTPTGVTMIGRLAPGVSLTQLRGRLGALGERLAAADPAVWTGDDGRPRQLAAVPAWGALLSEQGVLPMIGVAAAVVALILSIAGANVANLLLTRAHRRRREIAVRLAIGAGRARLIHQLLAESMLLTTSAALVGLALVHGLTRLAALGRLPIPDLPSATAVDLAVDVRVSVFAVALALSSGVLLGAIPALRASRPDLVAALRGATGNHRLRWFGPRSVLVAAQVAGSLLFLTVAALLLRDIQHAADLELGFDPHQVAILPIELPPATFDPEASFRFHDALAARLRAVPGVRTVALSQSIPFSGVGRCGLDRIEGVELAGTVRLPCGIVSPGYFSLARIPLLYGREFVPTDRRGAPEVVVVNRALAERFWPGEEALGKRIGDAEVVGVVADSRFQQLTDTLGPRYWVPYRQAHVSRMWVHVRTDGDPRPVLPALRNEVLALGPGLLDVEPKLMEQQVAAFTAPQRALSAALGTAGGVALLMAMLGLYGVMAYLTGQRTHEVGVRIALGARPGAVVRMIVAQGLGLAALGLIAGTVAVAGVGPLLEGLLVGLHPLDPIALLGCLLLLVTAVVAASLVPARRAARVQPVEALRAE